MATRPILQYQPLKFSKFDTGRIKCTCLDVSPSYLVFGANTGSLYIYERESLLFLQIITNPGPVEKIKFSPDGNLLAIVTEPDHDLYIVEHLLKKKKPSKTIVKITDHKEPITSIIWSVNSQETEQTLFSADSSGVIFKTSVSSGGAFSILPPTTTPKPEYIFKSDSEVVQIDYDNIAQQLAVSSKLRTSLINFSSGSAKQVGKKERNGNYGAIHSLNSMQKTILVASRPVRHLWIADSDSGKVNKTLKFHDQIVSNITPCFSGNSSTETPVNPKSVNFAKLVNFGDCVLSWSDTAIIYVDVERELVLQCHVDIEALRDIAVYEQQAYLLHGADQMKVSLMTFDSIARLDSLLALKDWAAATRNLTQFQITDLSVLQRVKETMAQEPGNEDFVAKVDSLIETIEQKKRDEEAQTGQQQSTSPEKPIEEALKNPPNQSTELLSGEEPVPTSESEPEIDEHTTTEPPEEDSSVFPFEPFDKVENNTPEALVSLEVVVTRKEKSSRVGPRARSGGETPRTRRKVKKQAMIADASPTITSPIVPVGMVSNHPMVQFVNANSTTFSPSDTPTAFESSSGSQHSSPSTSPSSSSDAIYASYDDSRRPTSQDLRANHRGSGSSSRNKSSTPSQTPASPSLSDSLQSKLSNSNIIPAIEASIASSLAAMTTTFNEITTSNTLKASNQSIPREPKSPQDASPNPTRVSSPNPPQIPPPTHSNSENPFNLSNLPDPVALMSSMNQIFSPGSDPDGEEQLKKFAASLDDVIESIPTAETIMSHFFPKNSTPSPQPASPRENPPEEASENGKTAVAPMIIDFPAQLPSVERTPEDFGAAILVKKEAQDGLGMLHLIKQSNQPSLFKEHLIILFTLCPGPTATYAAQQYPSIVPSTIIEAFADNAELRLLYIHQLLESERFWYLHEEHSALMFHEILQHDPPQHVLLFSSDQIPKQGAGEVQWTQRDRLISILQQTIPHIDHVPFMNACKEAGFFEGLMLIYQTKNMFKEAAQLLLLLDDKRMFASLTQENTSICLESNWEYILGEYSQYYRQSTNITAPMLVDAMSKTIGALATVKILIQFSTQEPEHNMFSDLPVDIFQTLISDGEQQIHRKETVQKALQLIDNYLWSPKHSALGPQFLAMANIEQAANVDYSKIPFISHETGEPKLTFQLRTPTTKFLEDCNTHWGVKVDLEKICSRSGLPLSVKVGSNPRIIAFPSGNCYHEGFLPEDACALTMQQNFGSLLDD